MDKPQQSESAQRFLASLTFHRYIFNKIEFVHNESYNGEEVQIDFRVGHNIALNTDQSLAQVILTCTVFPDAKINTYPFTIYAEMTGIFGYDSQVDDDLRDTLIGENAIAIMFPYIRSAISSVTASAGVPPLVLQPINVVEYLKSQKEQPN